MSVPVSPGDPVAHVHAWLRALPAGRLAALAAELATGLAADGLTVYRASEARFDPITPSLSPEPIDDDALARLGADARVLLRAAVKAARWSLEQPFADRLYAGFTPLEQRALAADPARLATVATARVDYFPAPAGPRALELNATIPAMQGYSDLIAHRWLRLMARERGQDAAPLVAANGSNTLDLLASLVAHYHKAGGRAELPSILIVSRRGDSQLGELRHYERAFAAAGHRAQHVYVDELELVDGRPRARGERFDFIYRHIFARRVEENSVLGRLLVDPGEAIVLNPVVSPLEVKGLLGLMHEEATTGAAGAPLDDEERAVIARAVPWTRVLAPGPAGLPDGDRAADLVAWAAGQAHRLVLKRSWDYGGKGVHIGPDVAPAEWAGLVERAAGDGQNPWVVQELVPPVAARHLLVAADGSSAWREVWVDVSAFTNLGVAPLPRGGVCRASSSKIVNIASGGGVAPLISRSVLAALFPS